MLEQEFSGDITSDCVDYHSHQLAVSKNQCRGIPMQQQQHYPQHSGFPIPSPCNGDFLKFGSAEMLSGSHPNLSNGFNSPRIVSTSASPAFSAASSCGINGSCDFYPQGNCGSPMEGERTPRGATRILDADVNGMDVFSGDEKLQELANLPLSILESSINFADSFESDILGRIAQEESEASVGGIEQRVGEDAAQRFSGSTDSLLSTPIVGEEFGSTANHSNVAGSLENITNSPTLYNKNSETNSDRLSAAETSKAGHSTLIPPIPGSRPKSYSMDDIGSIASIENFLLGVSDSPVIGRDNSTLCTSDDESPINNSNNNSVPSNTMTDGKMQKAEMPSPTITVSLPFPEESEGDGENRDMGSSPLGDSFKQPPSYEEYIKAHNSNTKVILPSPTMDGPDTTKDENDGIDTDSAAMEIAPSNGGVSKTGADDPAPLNLLDDIMECIQLEGGTGGIPNDSKLGE